MAYLIKQPASVSPAAFMQRALDLVAATKIAGWGNAYGAVIVSLGKIVSEGANTIYADNDPTANGEVEAIKDAC